MPTRLKHVRIDPDVAAVLTAAECAGPRLFLKGGRLDRGLYERTNKVVTALGGRWSRKEQAHVFPSDCGPLIAGALADGRALDKKQTYQFFETPPDLAARMVELAGVGPGMSVLEPSAGRGAIADAVRSACPEARITCVELDDENVRVLAAKGYETVGVDFMVWGEVKSVRLSFDRVVMNPPFTGLQDVAHVRRAYTLLRPGGRLVSVLSWAALNGSRHEAVDFADWLAQMVSAGSAQVYELPAGTFRASRTDVKAALAVVTRPGT